MAAISRARSDVQGPGQRFATALVEVSERLAAWGGFITTHWTPAHLEMEGDEIADLYAAVNKSGRVEKSHLRETSFAYITGVMTKRKTRMAARWISKHVKSCRCYRPPKGTNLRPELREERKGWRQVLPAPFWTRHGQSLPG